MTTIFKITKKHKFEASHKLNLNYQSPCSYFHGHSYQVEITICTNKLDENGMVIDFSKLGMIKNWIDANWDHSTIISKSDPDIIQYIGDKNFKVFEFNYENVTAENMCLELLNQTQDYLKDLLIILSIEISIWETVNNKATVIRTY